MKTQKVDHRYAYEQRTELKVVPVRLNFDTRQRLERLELIYRSKRGVIERALELLESIHFE